MEHTSFKIGDNIADFAIDENQQYIEPKIPVIGVITNIFTEYRDYGQFLQFEVHWMDIYGEVAVLCEETVDEMRENYVKLIEEISPK